MRAARCGSTLLATRHGVSAPHGGFPGPTGTAGSSCASWNPCLCLDSASNIRYKRGVTSITPPMDQSRLRSLLDELERPGTYQLLNHDGTPPTQTLPLPLGQGGSSIVFRAHYQRRLLRAIKIMVPRDDLLRKLSSERFFESFDNELEALSRLTHEHLAKLTDFGRITLDDVEYPYIVTDFVHGQPLTDFAQHGETTASQLLATIDQILEALQYLHSHSVMHCDVKPANILVNVRHLDTGIQTSATLLDLGVSRYVGRPALDFGDNFTYFFSTRAYVMPLLEPFLATETENKIAREDLERFFPLQDLYSIGVILRDLLAEAAIRESVRKEFGSTATSALAEIQTRLLSLEPGHAVIPNTHTLRRVLDRATQRAAGPIGVAELAVVPGRRLSIPTNRVRVPLTDRAEELLNHPLVQRLHHVPQLDQLHLVLPGASHSRFLHTLHTYDLARNALVQLLTDWRVHLDARRESVEAVLFKALLDDVGHYHFVHMFEDFVVDRSRVPQLRDAGILSDTEVFRLMVGDSDTAPGHSLASVFAEQKDHNDKSLADIVTDLLGEGWLGEVRALASPATPIDAVFGALLSSPVDVDKVSYLIDDSLSTGLRFGRGLDPTAIFSGLVIPDEQHWNEYGRQPCIGIRESVLAHVEDAVLARYWQIQRGYWHRTNRSLQAMIKFAISELLLAGRFDFTRFVAETLYTGSDSALRWLHARFQEAQADHAIAPEVVNPLDDLVIARRRIYKRLVTISPRSMPLARARDRVIFEGLRDRSPVDDRDFCRDIAEQLESAFDGLSIAPGEVLLDMPRRNREELGGKVLVYSDEPTDYLGELFTISPVLRGLSEAFDVYAKRLRLFVHPRVADQLEGEDEHQRAYETILDYLRSRFPPS